MKSSVLRLIRAAITIVIVPTATPHPSHLPFTMAKADRIGNQRVRLDSLDTTRADLYGGPNVVLPPKHFMAPDHISKPPNMTKNHPEEIVSSEDDTSPINTPMSTPPMVTSDDFALAFDIDGVLIKGGKPIPEAVDAMKYINGENPYGVKV